MAPPPNRYPTGDLTPHAPPPESTGERFAILDGRINTVSAQVDGAVGALGQAFAAALGDMPMRMVRLEASVGVLSETVKEDHARLRAISDGILAIKNTLESLGKAIADHDRKVDGAIARISDLEKWRENLAGKIAIVSGLAAGAVALIVSVLGKLLTSGH